MKERTIAEIKAENERLKAQNEEMGKYIETLQQVEKKLVADNQKAAQIYANERRAQLNLCEAIIELVKRDMEERQ